MKLIITINQFKQKPKVFTTTIGDIPLSVLKLLWEAEQTLNNIPGANLRVHIDVEE